MLATLGLRLAAEKTRVVHIDEGFDFLNVTIRRMRKRGTSKHYVYTKPSKKAIQAVKDKVTAKTYRSTLHQEPEVLIASISQTLRGWANYHRHGVAKACSARSTTMRGTGSCAGCGVSTTEAPGWGCQNSGGASASREPGSSRTTGWCSPARRPCRSPLPLPRDADPHPLPPAISRAIRLIQRPRHMERPVRRAARRVRREDRGNPRGAILAGRPDPTRPGRAAGGRDRRAGRGPGAGAVGAAVASGVGAGGRGLAERARPGSPGRAAGPGAGIGLAGARRRGLPGGGDHREAEAAEGGVAGRDAGPGAGHAREQGVLRHCGHGR